MSTMTPQDALYHFLRGQKLVTDRVANRIFRRRLPANPTYPAITILVVSDVDENHQGGAAGLADARVQISIWDKKGAGRAAAIRAAIRDVLHGYADTIVQGSRSLVVQAAWIENSYEIVEPPTDASQTAIDQIALDVRIDYQPAAPAGAD